MPPKPLFDISSIDQNTITVTKEQIYSVNPHRFEFQQVDGIYFVDYDTGLFAGYKDVHADEFWVRGHIPGRPIFPGILMIETAAHLLSYYAMSQEPDKGFLGFGSVERVKFRGTVVPGDRIIFLGKMLEIRPRRCVG